MLKAHKFARTISKSARKTLLKDATIDNMVILNIWQPGYKIEQTIKTKDNLEKKVKVFFPTSTVEAALSFLIKQHGSEQSLQFKSDVHPGHCSIQIGYKENQEKYLSIGTDEEFNGISINTQHTLTYMDSFLEDVLAFRRFPERRFDFYTLNIEEIDKTIELLKKGPPIFYYSLLGSRLNLTEGESCATASYRCLQAGGIEELLYPYRSIISSETILTPLMLAKTADLAQSQELSCNKNLTFYKEFEERSETLKNQLEEQMRSLSLDPSNNLNNTTPTPKPKF